MEMMTPVKRKHTTLNIEQKVEILDALQSKAKTRKELADSYGIDLATVTRITQQEAKIRSTALENGNPARKRLRKGLYEELDHAVSEWFHLMRANNIVVNGPMIREEAKKFAQRLNLPNFEASNGWLGRWKAKENVSFLKRKSDRGNPAADQDEPIDCIQNEVPFIQAEYYSKDIYYASESGLFYKALPASMTAVKPKKAAEVKPPEEGKKPKRLRKPEVKKPELDKDRLTTLFLCNLDGSDKHIFVIGRVKQPISFQGRKLPFPYYASSKAWMTSSVWTKILQDFDRKLIIQKRKALLYVDDVACHKLEEGTVLKNVDIQFMSANTCATSITRPLEYGVIRAFKVYYRHKLLRQQLIAREKGLTVKQFVKTVSLLEAMRLIEQAWLLITSTTIQNSFRKAGFMVSVDDGGGGEPQVDGSVIPLHIAENEFNEYIECDANLYCYGELTDDDIVNEVHQLRSEHDEEKEAQQATHLNPNRKDALAALSVLRAYLDHKNEDLKNLSRLEDQFCDMTAKCIVQKKISDYFYRRSH